MNQFIDNYCERMGPGLFNEPMNAVTNIAFIIAAMMVVRLAKRENALNQHTKILASLIALIGIGSFLFHTFATRWAMMTDTIPILIYQIAFLCIYASAIIKRGPTLTYGMLGGFLVLVFGCGFLPRDLLNGSVAYAPAFVFLVVLGFYHWAAGKREEYLLITTAPIFLMSLMFRTFDNLFCDVFPIGTHYIWHVLNAFVLYLTARAYVINAPKENN